MLIKNKGNEPSKENHKKAAPLKKFVLINCIISLLIFLFFTVIAVTEDITAIFAMAIFIPVQWVISYLLKWSIQWSIQYLKIKSPADWRAVLSVWIACVAFLILSLFCLISIMDMDEDGMSAPFIIGSLNIAAVLATVLFSIKKMKGE
jgi:hypothetical protein